MSKSSTIQLSIELGRPSEGRVSDSEGLTAKLLWLAPSARRGEECRALYCKHASNSSGNWVIESIQTGVGLVEAEEQAMLDNGGN